MNNDFLRNYMIPTLAPPSSYMQNGSDPSQHYNHINNADTYPTSTTAHLEPPPEAPTLPGDNGSMLQFDQCYSNPSRFVPPGKYGTDYLSAKSSIKRKYSTPVEKNFDINTRFMGRDESYPDGLNALFKPLFCELCNVQLNSPKTASVHYMSKAHDKNITSWLYRNYTDKGLEAPAIKRFFTGSSGPVGPNAYHCETCDLQLTSKSHADQHYSGRRHKLVLNKISKPSGAGYYNSDGKWVRTSTKLMPKVDKDGRFGIGESFKYVGSDAKQEAESGMPQAAKNQNKTDPDSLICKVCNVTATSSLQMSLHLEGSKHQKRLKASEENEGISVPVMNSNAWSGLNDTTGLPNDLSMYRTPSGSYYCKTCNISITHQTALTQHLVGKKHIRKLAVYNKLVEGSA